MKRAVVTILAVLVIIASIAVGCTKQNDTKEPSENQMGTINFEVVDANDVSDEDIKAWYEEKLKLEGINSIDTDEYKYILIGSGEKPTAGYSVEVISVEGNEEEITIDAKLNAPEEDQMVAEVITYPNILIRIAADDREVVLDSFQTPTNDNSDNDLELSKTKGIFVGQIDNNSVEIKVEGKPTAFRLSQDVISKLQEYQPPTGQEVEFTFNKNENNQLVITELSWASADIIGVYVGQIDNNSIEIEVDGKPSAYRLSNEVKNLIGEIKEGDHIEFIYEKNQNGQLIITSFKKVDLGK